MAKLKYKDTDGTWKPISAGSSNSEVQKTTEAEISAMGFTKNQGTITEVKMNGVSKGTSGVVDLGNVITEHQSLEGYAKDSELATVAKSGSYNDLTNKPTIPSAVTESTVSGWGFTKNTGTYSKPSTGIPSTDLSSDVQSALTKANSALQSETYKGTVTGVKMNGAIKNPSDGIVDLGTVLTSHQDISGKQDKLVSGTNIKTVNGVSILGSGNITIEGSSSGSVAYPVVNHGTDDTTFVLTPNTFHIWGEISSIDLSLGDEINGVMNEYLFQFTCGSVRSTLTFPENIRWKDVEIPEFRIETTYRISIINGFGVISAFDNPNIVYFYANRSPYSFLYLRTWEGLTWEQWVSSEYNTQGFVIEDGKIWYNSAKQYELLDTDPTDVIIPGHTYEFEFTD